jgi:hypothetical protein
VPEFEPPYNVPDESPPYKVPSAARAASGEHNTINVSITGANFLKKEFIF